MQKEIWVSISAVIVSHVQVTASSNGLESTYDFEVDQDVSFQTMSAVIWTSESTYFQQLKQTKWLNAHITVAYYYYTLLLCIVTVFMQLYLCLPSAMCLSVCFLSSSLTCSISRICHNRSDVKVNFLIHVISFLHNLTEAQTHTHTLTHRDDCQILLLCVLCLLFTLSGKLS